MKLLIDMNLSPRWGEAIELAGFEAVHWSDIGEAGASDEAIMGYAAAHDLVVLTHDLDFSAILAATGANGPSVIQLRGDDITPEAGSSAVVAALRQCADEIAEGAVLTIDLARVRLTLLPLRR